MSFNRGLGDVEIETILFDRNDEILREKWNLLFWSIGLSALTPESMQCIPSEYTVTVLALTFLVRAREINIMQADALLVSQYNILQDEIDLHKFNFIDSAISTENIRIGQVFVRAISLLWDCFAVCGLQAYLVIPSQVL